MYLQDPSTKEKSPTLTLMWVGVSVALLKLLLAGSTILGMQFGDFSGADFAMVVAPFIALYGHKRQVQGAKAPLASERSEQTDGSTRNTSRKPR